MSTDVCLVRDPAFLKHQPAFEHPENAGRLGPLYRQLAADPVLSRLPVIVPKTASDEALARVHAVELIERLKATRGKSGWLDGDTYFTPDTVDTALLAAGVTIDAALRIWRGEYRRGFTFARPPGHHATRGEAMGFCHLNHVALAVAAIRAESPQARLAIVDFDLHHGNGTQEIFYEDPNVLFLSSHRYPFYPGTGALDEVGEGRGRGTTVNFPVAAVEGESFFVPLYRAVAMPVLEAFAPEMILVSAGFDGHFLDPMMGLRLQTSTYSFLSDLLLAVAERQKGKILFVLEGGYHPTALADAAVAVVRRLIEAPRHPFSLARGEEPGPQVMRLLDFHRRYFPEI